MADIFTLKPASTVLFNVDDSGNVTCAGTFSSTGTDDFGTSGIKADVVAESTSGAGVTVDGALIKDAHILDSVGFYDAAAPTKIVRLDAGAVTAGQTRVLAMPDANVTITSAAATVLDDTTVGAMVTTLDAGLGSLIAADAGAGLPYVSAANTWASLTLAADKGIRASGAGTLVTYDLTAAGLALLDDANAAAQATTLGLGTGDSPTWTGGTFSGTVNLTDGSLLQRSGAGGTTGDVIERIGATVSEGMEVRVFEATVAPAAIETALFTVPTNSVIDSVQCNVATALTGGGTTVTFSVGVTGDVDKYGTAGNPTDLLTQNAKLNAIGSSAAGAGAGIGVFSSATQALALIGAATGGATAGDTALTAGTVRVVVRYRTLISLANA